MPFVLDVHSAEQGQAGPSTTAFSGQGTSHTHTRAHTRTRARACSTQTCVHGLSECMGGRKHSVHSHKLARLSTHASSRLGSARLGGATSVAGTCESGTHKAPSSPSGPKWLGSAGQTLGGAHTGTIALMPVRDPAAARAAAAEAASARAKLAADAAVGSPLPPHSFSRRSPLRLSPLPSPLSPAT
jgi:hypothetical protein